MAHLASARLLALAGAVALGTVSALAQSTLNGTWTLDVDTPQGLMKVDLTIAVEGPAATGVISSEMGDSKFRGTATDDTVTFSFDMVGPQGPMTVTTKATAAGDTMKGEMDYGMGVAPFTGKRAEQ